ncbi:hypothetical protein AX16_009468 [Volvariella volvacea WC 439]|nr:hypothetical protein AX16_009468 [Volvariella volvacea WC 439]
MFRNHIPTKYKFRRAFRPCSSVDSRQLPVKLLLPNITMAIPLSEEELKSIHEALGGDAAYDEFIKGIEEFFDFIRGIPPALQKYSISGSVDPEIVSTQVGLPTIVKLQASINNEIGIPRAGSGFGWAFPRLTAGFNFKGFILLRNWSDLNTSLRYKLYADSNFFALVFFNESWAAVGWVIGIVEGGISPSEKFSSRGKFDWSVQHS